MTALHVLLYIMLGIGLFFNVVGIAGLLRFPDVYTRLHAETKTTTFGSVFLTGAVAVYGLAQYLSAQDSSSLGLCVHVVIAIVVLAFTNAAGSHAIAQAAYSRGQQPSPSVVDRLSEVPEAGAEEEI